jgi:hypothetical protein
MGSRAWDRRKDYSHPTQPPTFNVQRHLRTEPSGPQPCRRGARSSPLHDFSCEIRRTRIKLSFFQFSHAIEPDRHKDVGEDFLANPVADEIRGFIGALNEDEQIDLVALAWLGRGDGTIDEWDELRADAARAHIAYGRLSAWHAASR